MSGTGEAESAAGDTGHESNAPEPCALDESHVLRVRLGHGANCSSIGSLVDAMFATAAIGGAVLASVVAALGNEPIRIAGESAGSESSADPRRAEPGLGTRGPSEPP